MENMFQASTICFCEKPDLSHSNDIIPKKDDEIYGSCVIGVDSMEISSRPIVFHFMVDVSGSMSDVTENGRTKMQLIVHTLTNMVHYFASQTQNVSIQVKGFDDNIHPYIDLVEVTAKNVDVLAAKLLKMRPQNLTNIELALETMKNDIEKIASIENTTYKQVGIFLTDGDATTGETCSKQLGEIVPDSIPFHFIALGKHHNPYLMHHLGHRTKYTNNWFINELEQTGNVYGEILYNELNRIAENVTLEVKGGRIYEYYTNQFVTQLSIGSIYADTEKHYHILADNDECSVLLRGSYCVETNDSTFEVEVSDVPSLYTPTQSDDGFVFNHYKPFFKTIQYYRLCTQMYMAKARIDFLDGLPEDYQYGIDERLQRLCHTNGRYLDASGMNEFLTHMDLDMNVSKLTENEYMKSLCDDIKVLIHTLGSMSQIKYAALREDVQGQERTSNTVTDVENDYDKAEYGNGILQKPVLSRSATTPYRTPGRVDLMDTMSQDREDSDPMAVQTSMDQDIFAGFRLTPPPVIRRSQNISSSSNV
jgi:uncharacterized protein YegL